MKTQKTNYYYINESLPIYTNAAPQKKFCCSSVWKHGKTWHRIQESREQVDSNPKPSSETVGQWLKCEMPCVNTSWNYHAFNLINDLSVILLLQCVLPSRCDQNLNLWSFFILWLTWRIFTSFYISKLCLKTSCHPSHCCWVAGFLRCQLHDSAAIVPWRPWAAAASAVQKHTEYIQTHRMNQWKCKSCDVFYIHRMNQWQRLSNCVANLVPSKFNLLHCHNPCYSEVALETDSAWWANLLRPSRINWKIWDFRTPPNSYLEPS